MRVRGGEEMKADMQKLKDVAKEKGLNFERVAAKIGIDRATFYRKVNAHGERFTIGEVHRMVEEATLTRDEAIAIFLPQYSQKCEKKEGDAE